MELCTHIPACPSAAANCVTLALNSCLEEGNVAPARAVKTVAQNFLPAQIQSLGMWQILDHGCGSLMGSLRPTRGGGSKASE